MWTKATWTADEETLEQRKEFAEKKPTVLTREQAKIREMGVDKSGGSGIIKSGIRINMQFFAKKSEDFATIILPKKEYAHVMSEIATNISEEHQRRKVFKKAIGDYMYTVENNGFGNYRIIGKDRIE